MIKWPNDHEDWLPEDDDEDADMGSYDYDYDHFFDDSDENDDY